MTVHGWLVTVLLVAAATAVAWPARTGRARRRAVLEPAGRDRMTSGSQVAGRALGRRIGGARATAGGGRGGEHGVPGRPPIRPPGRRDATHPTAATPVPVGGRRLRAALSLNPTSAGPAVTWSVGGIADPLGGAPTSGTGTQLVGPVGGYTAEAPAEQVQRAPSGAPVGDRLHGGLANGQVQDGPVAGLFRVLGVLPAVKPAGLPAGGGAVRGRLLQRVGVVASRRGLLPAVLVGGAAGAVLGGPVAAIVLAAYGALAARAARRRSAHQLTDRARRRELDQLCALAADLRAGLPVNGSVADGPHRIARLARSAVRLADRTGAPLAELLERVEADARAADRGLAAAAAQAAGARATAWLLAALPLGGLGLGYAIGVDPVAVLLHTAVGGGCALAAVALQFGGLLWAERLGATPGRHD
ncbi:hypothetical protein [Micromonospora sp. NPDC093277]|uniref:hypothetical protein n=1 Tax=Micromonospora sp. NPDC093277 TaxID=3364291 RepID=UPI0038302ABD